MRQADEVSQRVLWNLLRKGSQPHEKSRNRRLGRHGCRHRTDAACQRLCSACVRSAAGRGGGLPRAGGGRPQQPPPRRGGLRGGGGGRGGRGAGRGPGVLGRGAQTESVVFGAGGAAAAMKPGSTFVMCSTVDPHWSAALEDRLGQAGIHYIDAPISGGAAQAPRGQMTVMSSAKPQAYAQAGAVLDAMAGKVYRLGDRAGAGSKVKIINQLLAGVHIAAAAAAMALGLREGGALDALYEVITHSAGNSWMFENRMAHVLAGDYTPLSAVDIFVKDLGLVLDTARASKFPLPLASTAHQMFMQASSAGFANEDDSAVIKIFPGIE